MDGALIAFGTIFSSALLYYTRVAIKALFLKCQPSLWYQQHLTSTYSMLLPRHPGPTCLIKAVVFDYFI
jgi:hypothetical protein